MAVRFSIIGLATILFLHETLAAPSPGGDDADQVWEENWSVRHVQPKQVVESGQEMRENVEPAQEAEEPVEEAEDYMELLKVDWTLFSGGRLDYFSTELELARRQRSHLFRDAWCDPSRRDQQVEEQEKEMDRCCKSGKVAGNRSLLTDNLFVACSNFSVHYDPDAVCKLFFSICCEQAGLKEFYVNAINRSKDRKSKKKNQSKVSNPNNPRPMHQVHAAKTDQPSVSRK